MNKLSFRNLLSSSQISVDDINLIFSTANKYHSDSLNGIKSWNDCKDIILATLFFEPSTRTRFSFESSMLRLGGKIITLESGEASSIKKGESLSDMGRIVSEYADMIVIRHPKIHSAKEFSEYSSSPVINGGDGINEHPTQSLTDIYTIKQEKNKLNNLTIAILGDLKYGRTVYSMLKLMSLYPNNKFILISHPLLKLDINKRKIIEKTGCEIIETEDLDSVISELDVLYVTRVQKERFKNEKEYNKIYNKYSISKKDLQNAKDDLIIMHALPRLTEINIEIDKMSQAKYFQQAKNAIFVRMSLLSLIKL